MRITGVSNNVRLSRVSNVALRMTSIRTSLRKYGSAIIDLGNKIDNQALSRLSNIYGKSNISITRSKHATLKISNFK